MKKHVVYSALTVGSLFASVAFADEPVYPPCNGNFGITYPNRCTPTPPTPDIPDEAFLPAPEVVIEVAPMQAPAPVQQAPAQAPCVEARPVPQLLPPARLGFAGKVPQGRYGLFQNANRVREVGMRSLSGDGDSGGSLYFRTHRSESRVALELSVDAVDDVALTQASIVAYSRHQGAIRPFVFVGGGAYIETPGFSFQTGIGFDVNLTQRLTFNVDARYLVAGEVGGVYYESDCLDCNYNYDYDDNSFDGALISAGLGWKFGALGKSEKTIFQNKLSGSTASAFQNSRASFSPWSQPRSSWSQRAQGGLLGKSFGKSRFVREVGARSYTDLADGGDDIGGGIYLKTSREGGRLGSEASLDAIGDNLLLQTSLIGYLNPKGTVRPYGLVGLGAELISSQATAQWGLGVDVAITKRVALSADLRGITGSGSYTTLECDAEGFCSDSYNSLDAFVGGVGVGYKF